MEDFCKIGKNFAIHYEKKYAFDNADQLVFYERGY